MPIVIDSSAIIAILLNEPERVALENRLAAARKREISAANYVEAGAVLAGRLRDARASAGAVLDRFLDEAAIDIVPVDGAQARLALEARIRFGKGFGHPAGLNYGDSFAYALAKHRDAPLLFVGDDFSRTDIRIVT